MRPAVSVGLRTLLAVAALIAGGDWIKAQTPATETRTILFSMTAKEGKEQELTAIIPRLVRQSRADDGNISYTFLQQRNNPREFVLFEQWRDPAALTAHLKHLQATFGPPREGGSIPASILDLCDKTQSISYLIME